MAKRLAAIGVESTEERRRSYRELLFTTRGLGDHISGVILFDETLRQRAADGTPLPEVLRRQGVIPGIKVDRGTTPLAGFPDEVVTEGLDGLRGRLAEYAALGARFAKWRAVIRIGEGRPPRLLRRGQRARAGPVRRARPGGGPGPDRGARGAHGRRALARALRRGHGGDPAGALRRSSPGTASSWRRACSSPTWCSRERTARSRCERPGGRERDAGRDAPGRPPPSPGAGPSP